MGTTQTSPLRTIRLQDPQIDELIDAIEAQPAKALAEHRGAPHFRFRARNCRAHFDAQGAASDFIVHPRCLSANGMTFLHGVFAYPGTRCEVRLIGVHGSWRLVPGVVARCDYLPQRVYELGVTFSETIDPREFTHDAVRHRVLVVDDSELMRRTAQIVLGKLNVDVETAAGAREALEITATRQFDLYLIDIEMPDTDGYETLKLLRGRCHTGMFAALTARTQTQDQERCLAEGFDSYLAKPLDLAKLAELLKCLHQEPIVSTLANQAEYVPLIDAYIPELIALVGTIRTLFAASDFKGLEATSRTLKASSGTLGFEPISKAAAAIESAVCRGAGQDELRPLVRDLLNLSTLVRVSAG